MSFCSHDQHEPKGGRTYLVETKDKNGQEQGKIGDFGDLARLRNAEDFYHGPPPSIHQ